MLLFERFKWTKLFRLNNWSRLLILLFERFNVLRELSFNLKSQVTPSKFTSGLTFVIRFELKSNVQFIFLNILKNCNSVSSIHAQLQIRSQL